MKNLMLSCLFYILFQVVLEPHVSAAKNDKTFTFKYTLNTTFVRIMSPKDLDLDHYSGYDPQAQRRALTTFLQSEKSKENVLQLPKIVNNLYSTLKNIFL